MGLRSVVLGLVICSLLFVPFPLLFMGVLRMRPHASVGTSSGTGIPGVHNTGILPAREHPPVVVNVIHGDGAYLGGLPLVDWAQVRGRKALVPR